MYSYSVNTKEIQILSGMLGEIVGKFSFVEFGTDGPPEVQQFSRPKHPSLVHLAQLSQNWTLSLALFWPTVNAPNEKRRRDPRVLWPRNQNRYCQICKRPL